ncbi:MAG: ribonuclease P protein component [Paracoccaceae bacterium]
MQGEAVLRPVMIRKRRDFLAAARARRHAAAGLILQGRRRPEEEGDPSALRVGYTCSKKVGNAVARNRAKRRLRAAAAAALPRLGRPGWDYVLIGRSGVTAERVFTDLVADLETALARVHSPKPR